MMNRRPQNKEPLLAARFGRVRQMVNELDGLLCCELVIRFLAGVGVAVRALEVAGLRDVPDDLSGIVDLKILREQVGAGQIRELRDLVAVCH